jgi:N-acetylglucosamine kinase-like BadF-type ATPase
LLHDFLMANQRESGSLSEQIRRAAQKGDRLALKIVKDGVLDGLEKWTRRKP